jgi:hypothetical protein
MVEVGVTHEEDRSGRGLERERERERWEECVRVERRSAVKDKGNTSGQGHPPFIPTKGLIAHLDSTFAHMRTVDPGQPHSRHGGNCELEPSILSG